MYSLSQLANGQHVCTCINFSGRRKEHVCTCINPKSWHMYKLAGVCTCINMFVDVQTGLYPYKPAGAV